MSLVIYAVSKFYGEVQAVVNVDLEIQEGEFFTLLGPSGCGKTSLLRIVSGLELPDSGQVLLDRKDMTMTPASKRPVNTVFQSYALFPHMTVVENVAYGLLSKKVPKAEAMDRSRKALSLVRLDGFDKRYPHQMSGGQRQRVAMARALVNEPRILLLDEPMSALDARLRLEMQVELRALQQRLGTTFIMVTHDQQEALAVSDRIAVMNKGRIAQCGAVRDVYDKPQTRFVADFLGTENFIEVTRKDDHLVTSPWGDWMVGDTVPWEKGALTIRPEKIRFCEADAPGAWDSLITNAVYRGGYQVLMLENGLRIETDALVHWKSGDRITACCPPESLVVLHG